MLSTLLDVLGLAAFVAGTFVLAGLGVALLVAGAALMFVGYVTDDEAVKRAVARQRARARRALTAPARRVSAWRARPKAA